MRLRLLLALCTCCLLAPAARAQTAAEDELTLREAKIDIDGPGLVRFFQSRVLREADTDRVKALIGQLGAEEFKVREKAAADLLLLGPGVAPLLRESIRDADPEVASRAKECLRLVERTSTVPLLSAAARLLGQRKPAEAVKTLLDYAPNAPDEEVLNAIRVALLEAGAPGGKADPALTTALADRSTVRRGLAVETLARLKALDEASARKFLDDPESNVRLRAALALVERGDRAGVPVLCGLLAKIPLAQAWQAEDVLTRLAGEQAPQASVGQDEASRKAASEAWEKWWKEHGDKVDLARLKDKPPFLGLTLVVYQDFQGFGKAMETDKAGKVRWEVSNLGYPVDAQMTGADRFLVAELNGQCVTERNRKGEVLWKKEVQQPVACQRLPGGNTVIATQNQVLEYDAQGKQVFSFNRGRWDIMGCRKHRNGEYVLLTRNQIVRVDARGREVKSFASGQIHNYSSFEVLPGGNLLVPLNGSNQVVEFNLDGQPVWKANVPFPTSAQRLPNGNVLVASMNTRTILELDRTGKTVKQTQINGQPWCVFGR